MLKIFVFCLISVGCFGHSNSEECTIITSEFAPIVVRQIGTHLIAVEDSGVSTYKLKVNEKLQMKCVGGMKLYRTNYGTVIDDASINEVELLCKRNNLVAYKTAGTGSYQTYNEGTFQISCHGSSTGQSIFESATQLPNCRNNMTYAIGYKLQNHDIVSMGICYDFQTLSLVFANFLVQKTQKAKIINLNSPNSLKTVTLDEELRAVSSITDRKSKSFEILLNRKTVNPLVSRIFEYSTILPTAVVPADVSSFDNIFKIVWWSGLRWGNWHLWEHVLKERSKSVNYMTYLGSSGVVHLPGPCNTTEPLVFEDDEISINTPEHIWMYLTTMDTPVTEEFVLIAHNSPYYLKESFNSSSICDDICDDIDWLKNSLLGGTRKMFGRGLIVCCRPKDVANKLENFVYPFQKKKIPKPWLMRPGYVPEDRTTLNTDIILEAEEEDIRDY